MANLNVAMVMGRLVADPELKYSPNGIPMCRMCVATNKKFKKADGSPGEKTLFLDVDAWRRLAEICAQFLKKGREVFISGELVQSKWVDAQGQKRSKIRLNAETVQFIGAPKQNPDDSSSDQGDAADSPEPEGEAAE